MSESIIVKHQQVCPKCDGENFKVYLVTAKNFYPFILGKKQPDLIFESFECVDCGWTSHDLTTEKLRILMDAALQAASAPRFETREAILTKAGVKRFKLKDDADAK